MWVPEWGGHRVTLGVISVISEFPSTSFCGETGSPNLTTMLTSRSPGMPVSSSPVLGLQAVYPLVPMGARGLNSDPITCQQTYYPLSPLPNPFFIPLPSSDLLGWVCEISLASISVSLCLTNSPVLAAGNTYSDEF